MTASVHDHLDLLGICVKDRVTGFTGVVTSITFDLYGCIQGLVHPGLDKEGKPLDQCWFDMNRLQIAGKRVMPAPGYATAAPADKGPSEKPRFTKV